jgi:hypothetical protein
MIRRVHRGLIAGIVWMLITPLARADEAEALFESNVRPVLATVCFRCHGGEKTSGGLKVDSREALLAGGDSGPAIVPGDPDGSLLMHALRRADDASAMPPDKPLPKEQVAAFAAWIRAGAKWPAATPKFAAARHWAFEPVANVPLPVAAGDNPIDAFLAEVQQRRGIQPLPPAERRTLLRRLAFHLIGLPPTPESTAEFLADQSPDAYARAVDRLLASPQYGERWGRHWLDLVRYADTAGENSDHPLPHAWRYRNWVIQAFNRDTPYDEFLRDQLAGDIVAAQQQGQNYADRVVATGYLAIARRFGHDIDKDMHLTYEDVIDTLGKSVLGLTIGCARCHSHKYDPVSSEDYYALYGIFESTRFAFPGCEPQQQPRDLVSLVPPTEWERTVQPFQEKLATIDAELKAAGERQSQLAKELAAAAGQQTDKLAEGEFDDGQSQEVAAGSMAALDQVEIQRGQIIELAVSPRGNHGGDSTRVELEIAEVGGEQRRWNVADDIVDRLLDGNPLADRQGNAVVWCFLDLRGGTKLLPESVRGLMGQSGLHAWRNGDTPSVFVNAAAEPIAVWTKLPPRSLFVHPAADGNVAIGWISPIDGVVRITGRIADAHPGGPDGVGWLLSRQRGNWSEAMAKLSAAQQKLAELAQQRSRLLASQPAMPVAYGVAEGKPANARLHERGDPEKLGKEVPRRWLELFGGEGLATEGSGRLALANKLTSPDNPLTPRVLVNRLWLHHFGQGLVKTPSDFGTRGEAPTHPELLDWLARELIRGDWQIKRTQRQMLLSAAYQRASDNHGQTSNPQSLDPTNDTYWRFGRRRLSAEEIRDALLTVSGELDPSPAGPHPFPPESSWNFTQHNPFSADYETRRRSVYLMVQRNRRHRFLGLFDGADPSASTPQRQVTTVPTQALYFMNDPFFHAQTEWLAQRVLTALPEQRLDELTKLLFQRPATTHEHEAAEQFLQTYAAELTDQPPQQREQAQWAAWARVLAASNEFLYVD